MEPYRQMPSTRPRSDSAESGASMWEKLAEHFPRTKKDAPFAIDEHANGSAEDEPISDEHEGNEIDSDTPPAPSLTTTASASPLNQQSKPWLTGGKHEQLAIIIHPPGDSDSTVKQLKHELAPQGLRWTDDEQKLSTYHFGLTALRIHFRTPQLINVQMLCASPSSTPFWLTFNKPEQQQQPICTSNQLKQAIQHKLTNDFAVELQYGALVDLNRFGEAPNHSWSNKRSVSWSMYLHDEQCGGGCIEWVIESDTVREKKQLLATNIHHCVVVDSREDGFDMYICQRCNLNEFEALAKKDNNNENRQQSGRRYSNSIERRKPSQDRPQHGPPHGFSSRLRRPPSLSSLQNTSHQPRRIVYEYYRRMGTRTGCYFPTVRFSFHANPCRVAENTKRSTQSGIKETLTLLIEYFLAHQITICYATITSYKGPDPLLFFLPTMAKFPSLIMKYSWQLLSTVGYGLQLRINDDFLRQLMVLTKEENNADELFYRVCVYLSRIFSLKPFVDIVAELEHAVRESKQKRDAAAYGLVSKIDTLNENEAYIPSVTLTPTTIRVKPLKLCPTNRVLRAHKHFGQPLYHFVLVDIRDENGRKLQAFHFGHLHDTLLAYLDKGFALMDDARNYTYLHHSQSQLRSKQFWFYHHHDNDDNFGNRRNMTRTEAYEWMGDFTRDRNPAKYAARMALCFSTTKAAVEVPDKEVDRMGDIEITVNNKVLSFTDGCGTMSEKLRNKIKKSLRNHSDFSAVQFRYAGCKGVVSLDTRLQRNTHLCIRPSMEKFNSPHRTFEVCRLSAPRPVFLNRQAILLLAYREISPVSFLQLQQRNQLQLIRALLRNGDAQALILEKVPWWFLPQDIHLARIDYIREPFFRQLLISACLQSTRDLLYRTRIRVPRDKGRNMMGIVDEYNVLKQGEVFIQFTLLDKPSKSDGETRILDECKVVITKNPCHHPGDIRTFNAVNPRELRHLKDVVVFSQQGERPAPHDISGSDLDGDEYLVLWHPDLVPLETANAEPYDYDAIIQQDELPRPVSRDDVNRKVLEIAELDCLGKLSNLHLAFADTFDVDDKETHG